MHALLHFFLLLIFLFTLKKIIHQFIDKVLHKLSKETKGKKEEGEGMDKKYEFDDPEVWGGVGCWTQEEEEDFTSWGGGRKGIYHCLLFVNVNVNSYCDCGCGCDCCFFICHLLLLLLLLLILLLLLLLLLLLFLFWKISHHFRYPRLDLLHHTQHHPHRRTPHPLLHRRSRHSHHRNRPSSP